MLGIFSSGNVFVITKNGIGRGFQPMELIGIILIYKWLGLDIYDVSAEEHQVRFFGIDDVYPAGQFGLPVAVANVQVAGQNHPQVLLLQGLFRCNGQLLAIFVFVVDASGYHNDGYCTEDGEHGGEVPVEPGFRK